MSNPDSSSTIHACPKCGGTTGRYLVRTIKKERFETWDGKHLSDGDGLLVSETWWRCMDCNAYKIPQGPAHS
jgi:hypothetical protein